MPNIPLSDFPNAPGLAPVAAPISAPAPNFDFGNLSGAVESLAQSQISGQALDTYGQGVASVAQGLSNLGKVPEQIAQHMLKAKNFADESELENLFAGALATHKQAIQNLPDSEYVPQFQKVADGVYKQMTNMPLSPELRQRAEVMYQNFAHRGFIHFSTEASKSQFERGKLEGMTAYKRDFANGLYEKARGRLATMRELGYLNAEQEGAVWQASEAEMQQNQEIHEISQDPFAVQSDMKEAQKTGQSSIFRRPMADGEIATVKMQAEQQIRKMQSQADDAITEGIYSSKITTEEQIREMAGPSQLPEIAIKAQLASLKKFEATTPAGLAKFKEAWMDLRADVASYNPEDDPKGEKGYDLAFRINSTIPTGYRETLTTELGKRKKAGKITPRQEVESWLKNLIRDDYEDQRFGGWKELKDTNAAREAKAKAASQAGLVMDAADEFLSQTPNASYEEASKWYDGNVKSYREGQRAQKSENESDKGFWNWSKPVPQPSAKSPTLPPPSTLKKEVGLDDLPEDAGEDIIPLLNDDDEADLSKPNSDIPIFQ